MNPYESPKEKDDRPLILRIGAMIGWSIIFLEVCAIVIVWFLAIGSILGIFING